MADPKIVVYPHPMLRAVATASGSFPCVNVVEVGSSGSIEHYDVATAKRLLTKSPRGVAIAANQVGSSVRFFVVKRELADQSRHGRELPTVVWDPRIVWKSDEEDVEKEGCLSAPGIEVPVPRARRIDVEFKESAAARRLTIEGFWARVVQHEVDHLDGKLIVDHLPAREKFRVRSLLLKGLGRC